ncbi:MAG TPA: hypothetical protein VFT82_02720, partial [Candidatus Paceibacterota bacterium]|nr:hypothetical protein [Candidatus Paceibacterota bacterium]
MKKSLKLAFAAMFVIAAPLFAQNNQGNQSQNDTIMVRKSDLPPELVKQLESQRELAQMSQKIETYGKWVGLGKEVGVAVNDSLSALTTQADKFSNTGVGKFTMFLVAYKVLGKDLLGALIGTPLLVAFFVVWIWSYRKNCIERPVLTSESKDGEKKFTVANSDDATRAGYA